MRLLPSVRSRFFVRVDGVLMSFGRVLMRLRGMLVSCGVVAAFMMFGRFVVMLRRGGVVLCCLLVCFDSHGEIL
jgi:hypothetical protein